MFFVCLYVFKNLIEWPRNSQSRGLGHWVRIYSKFRQSVLKVQLSCQTEVKTGKYSH